MTSCSEMPTAFQAICGDGKEYQRNSEGYITWIGTGNTPGDGITKNLWQAFRPGCLSAAGLPLNATGEVACTKLGGTVNTPWGLPTAHWGMLTVLRDSTATPIQAMLGNTSPDYRISLAQTFTYKRFNLYGLVDHSQGNKVMNEELHWSLGDFMVREEDQTGKDVATAKPIGYYWRATAPDNSAGIGGFYDVLGANSHTVEDGSYTKIRELSASYSIGKIPKLMGDWNFSVVGRNLYTFTKFKGWDPEVGLSGGTNNSAVINATAAYQYPPLRTFSFTLGSRF